jgi:hypothetical protein
MMLLGIGIERALDIAIKGTHYADALCNASKFLSAVA